MHNDILIETLHKRNLQRNIEERFTFVDCLKYSSVDAAYLDFIHKFMCAIDSVAQLQEVKVKANFKPWFDTNNLNNTKKVQPLFQVQEVRLRNGQR